MQKTELENAEQVPQIELISCEFPLSEQRYLNREILDTTDTLVLILDIEGQVIGFNQACEQIRDEILNNGKKPFFWDIFTQDEKEMVKVIFHEFKSNLSSIFHESNWISKNGKCHRIAWSYTPFLDSDRPANTPKYIIATGIDTISQQRETTQQRHLLEATTAATNTLLTVENFDEAVNMALQISKQNLNCHRLDLKQNQDELLVGAWCINTDNTKLQQAQEALLNSEQGRVAQLEAQNRLLENRDRILEATTTAANALLAIENFDRAVNTALKIIGESLDCDRVAVIENFAHPSQPSHWWEILYEWNSPHTVSQITHPNEAQGSYEEGGIAEWYERINQGKSLSYLLEEMPEPFRSGQAALGVKVLHVVPIFVESQCWGVLGFDDCREAKRRGSAELALLKTVAACIGSAIARQRTQQAEQKRIAELAKVNQELQQRDRLLSVVAQVTKNLLETEDIDVAIPTALQAIGEVANMSRVQLLLERQHPVTQKLQHSVTYEWVAEGIIPQINDPTMAAIDNDDVEVMVTELYAGRSIWRIVDHLPDTIRVQFESIGIKSSGGVPLFIEGRYIGCVAFDDCLTPRHWSQQEIDVLTTAAEGIGAALHRKQLVERLIAERAKLGEERVAELSRANESLRGCVNRLADEPDLETFWEHILLEASAQAKSYAAALFLYNETSDTKVMKRYVRDGQVLPIKTSAELEQFRMPVTGNLLSFWKEALFRGEAIFFNLDDWNQKVDSAIAWHRNQGHRSIVRVPLILGSRPLGFIGLCFREPRTGLPENIELIMALAQQATLAIHLTHLAEQSRQAAILEERNRMAREIHDTLAQAFTGVIVQLGAASRIVPSELAEVLAHITQARDLAREGLAEARHSVNALRPQILETSNLSKAFNRFAAQMSASIDTQIICNIIGEIYPLSVDMENNLLRIGQEALTNAIKYACASEIKIELVYEPTQFILRVKDNGQGFDTDSLSTIKGFGLMGIKERSDRISANLTIQSIAGQGTEITVLINRDVE